MLDLTCSIAGVQLRNPLILASGPGWRPEVLLEAAEAGAGAVTTKSIGPVARAGHPKPNIVEGEGWLLNAMGLPTKGVEAEVEALQEVRGKLAALGVPLIVSIFGATVPEFGQVAERVSAIEPDLIEVNISCPNAGDLGQHYAGSVEGAAAVTRIVKGVTDIPISVKLAPNVPNIGGIAWAAANAGADAITAINTMPAMAIDAVAGEPVLSNKVGGLSGPALKPIALRCVYEIAWAVDVPVIGTGGVSNGVDAIEMLMAGATAVGIATAVHYEGAGVFGKILGEMEEWMGARGYTCLENIRDRRNHSA